MPSYSRRSTDALVLVFAVLLAANGQAAKITGTVTDVANGGRLSSMVVRLYTPEGIEAGSEATTDSNGKYQISTSNGAYRILAFDPNGLYATSFQNGADAFELSPTLAVNGDVSGVDFGLQVGGTVSGRVQREDQGGIPQAVVAVYNLSGTRRAVTTTDGTGNYSIVLPPGQFKIVAYDNTKFYATEFYNNAPSFSTASLVTINPRTTFGPANFTLPRAGRVSGFVVDRGSFAPVPGLFISAYDEDGTIVGSQQMTTEQFDLALAPGTYRLVVSDPNHIFAPAFYGSATSFDESTPIAVTGGSVQSGTRIEVDVAGHITGHVFSSNNAPIPGINVSAYNANGSLRSTVTANITGLYQLDVPAGSFKVLAYDSNLVYAVRYFVQASNFESANLVSVATRQTVTADLRMDVGGTFTGTVRDALTNTVISGITVAAYNDSGQFVSSGDTDASGVYKVVVPAGAYHLAAFDMALRYATTYAGSNAYETSQEIAVASGASSPVNFTLTPGVVFSGTVKDVAGRPVSGVEVAILNSDGLRAATAHAENGSFSTAVIPGTYKLFASDANGRYVVTFYNRASSFATATPVTVTKDSSPPTVAFVLSPAGRHRAVGR